MNFISILQTTLRMS